LLAHLKSNDPERSEAARLWRQPGGYDVSVAAVDQLVDVSLEVPGVVGARLIGAGLGGSILAVVETARADALIEKLSSSYYRPRGLSAKAEVVSPVGGAGILAC
jgi:galactokinase